MENGPITVVRLAQVLGMHANSVRLHLDPLLAAGDVHRVVQPSAGPGRPAHAFVASPAGRAALADPGDSPLAGGLVPENVGQAVMTLRPYAVDVSGGVERSPGVKDADKIAAFVRNATI